MLIFGRLLNILEQYLQQVVLGEIGQEFVLLLLLALEVLEPVGEAALPLVEDLLDELLRQVQALGVGRQVHDVQDQKQDHNEILHGDFVLGVVQIVHEMQYAFEPGLVIRYYLVVDLQRESFEHDRTFGQAAGPLHGLELIGG